VTDAFTVEILHSQHDRTSFACGVAVLDGYFRQIASQDIRRRLSNCFVAVDPKATVAGYYTFAATGVPLIELPAEETRRLPRYPLVPAGLIGRLAVDRRFQNRGVGSLMIVDAVARAMRADTAIYALVVDAKDDAALHFYIHHGFRPFLSRPMTLFLPLAEAARRLRSRTQ
jgi:ribosomal protein S18 acetylase RimI-like enzyme